MLSVLLLMLVGKELHMVVFLAVLQLQVEPLLLDGTMLMFLILILVGFALLLLMLLMLMLQLLMALLLHVLMVVGGRLLVFVSRGCNRCYYYMLYCCGGGF
jgi:hypothetical protein